jgi:regulator of replication initiation timing
LFDCLKNTTKKIQEKEMSIEAMKQALKVLENKKLRMDEHLIPIVVDSLRQAIEQAEKQEPVRWFQQFGDSSPRKEWVELNLDDIPDVFVGDISFCQGAKWAQAKLKEKNT